MNIEKITALVPENEKAAFTADVFGNEGVYLTTAHIEAIEQALQDKDDTATGASQLTQQVTDQAGEIEILKAEKAELEEAAEAFDTERAEWAAKEKKLNDQLAAWGKKESTDKGGTNTPAAGDKPEKPVVASYEDPEDPFNAYVDRQLEARRRAKESAKFIN